MSVKRKEQSYHSPTRERQAEETRARILETARQLFAEHGYTSTSIARIADEAGVSPQTIYNSIGGKPALLLALNDLVDELAQVQDAQLRIGESSDPQEIMALTARLRRQMMERAGDVVAVLTAAAATDQDVARAYAEGQARSRAGTRRIVERLHSLEALREDLDIDRAADSAYTLLHHSLWARLVDECGWSADEFEQWCTELLRRLLLRPANSRGRL